MHLQQHRMQQMHRLSANIIRENETNSVHNSFSAVSKNVI